MTKSQVLRRLALALGILRAYSFFDPMGFENQTPRVRRERRNRGERRAGNSTRFLVTSPREPAMTGVEPLCTRAAAVGRF